MDGAWRRPPKSLADYGHTEPKRGAEWWGKSPFGYFWGSFPKVTRCQSGTLSGRYRSNGYAHNPTVLTVRPPSRASPLPQFDCGVSGRWVSAARPPSRASPLPQFDCGVSGREVSAGRPSSQASPLPHLLLRCISASMPLDSPGLPAFRQPVRPADYPPHT